MVSLFEFRIAACWREGLLRCIVSPSLLIGQPFGVEMKERLQLQCRCRECDATSDLAAGADWPVSQRQPCTCRPLNAGKDTVPGPCLGPAKWVAPAANSSRNSEAAPHSMLSLLGRYLWPRVAVGGWPGI